MNATVEDLLSTIGEQTVELRLLRQQVNALTINNNELNQELTKLKEGNKKEK